MGKLLAIASLGQRIYGRWLFQRLLPCIIAVTALTIVIGVMTSFLLIGALFAAYYVLLSYGIGQLMVMMIVGILALLIIVMLGMLMWACLRYLREMPGTLLKQSPVASQIIDALNAFSDGLMAD